MDEQPKESLQHTQQGDVSEAVSNDDIVSLLESSESEDDDLLNEGPQLIEDDSEDCVDDEAPTEETGIESAAPTEVNVLSPELTENVHGDGEFDEDKVTIKTTVSERSPSNRSVASADDDEFDAEKTEVEESTFDAENTDVQESEFDAENTDFEVTESKNGNANLDEPRLSSSYDENNHPKLPDGDDIPLDTIESAKRTENSDVVRSDENSTDLAYLNSSSDSDFFGFDSIAIEMSAEKTSELIQTLQNKESLLGHADKVSSVDATTAVVSSEARFVDVAPSMIGDSVQSDHADVQFDNSQSDPMTAQSLMKNSRKPNTVQTVYGLPINIFDETLPSGSKRVKKKRKFFDDFDEAENEKAPRKSSISRPNEDGVKILNNISGENKENFITDEKIKTESVPENDAASQNKAKRSYSFDISNPLFKEPFKYGWKREICYRHLPEGSKSKPAYVSYYSPEGKKFKTIRQIVEILPPDSELGTQHFTFSVQRVFNEPSEFEILRDAKSRTDLNDTDTVNHDPMSTTSPTNQLPPPVTFPEPVKASKKKLSTTPTGTRLVIKKPKYLKQADSEDDNTDTVVLLPSAPSSTTPKIVIKGASLNSNKVNSSKPKSNILKKDKKSVSKKQEKTSKKSLSSAENAHNSTREYANSFDIPSSTISKNNGDTRTCSFSCPLALGSVPTLQCTVCLGLYHFQCCGIDASQPVHSYVCKSCRSRADVQSNLLLAVSESSLSNALGYGGSKANAAAGAPPPPPPPPPRSVPKSTLTKIVDGVTTWLPPSSNVQLSSRHQTTPLATLGAPETTQTTLLQSVLELDGKRFIIVPKESIVSISPNTNSTVNTYSGSFDDRLHDEAVAQLPISPAVRATLISSMQRHAETARDYVNNSPDINSAGVLLVPVMPASGNDPFCNEIERGKRKLSDDTLDVPGVKMLKLQNEEASLRPVHYRSSLTLSNIAQMYNPLTACFKYLPVRDLLRASMSCKYLNRIASEPSLWTTVRLKNSKVRDWEGFARTLRKHGTKKLDLRKMLCPSAPDDVNAMWSSFLEKITMVTSLEHIEFSRCNAQVVESVARSCPNLVVINAIQLRNGDGLSIETFAKLQNLRELRLKGLTGLKIEMCPEELRFQSEEFMRELSLTSIKNLNLATVQAIGALSHLNNLELGECSSELVDELAVSIAKLTNLQRLRLEQITHLDPHFKLFESLKSLPRLKSLELINVEVKAGFCKAIATCTNIENLVVFPLYKTESATSNRLIMDSLLSLSKSLKSFVWGLTHELIKATDFYASQFIIEKAPNDNDDPNTPPKKVPDSIPIVKRISKQPEVDILSVRNLEKMVATALPQSHVKVITVANALTWRQN